LHFYPGSLTLLMGTVGCNFDCDYCQNSPVTRNYTSAHFRYQMPPRQLVQKARALNCQNIAFSVNEPAVSLPYFLEIAIEAKKIGLRVGCGTNAYFTESIARTVSEHVDFVNISLKSLSDDFYRKYCQVPSVAPVLRNLGIFHEKGVHAEVTTPILPDMDDAETENIARTLSDIGKDIPWHIFWLIPEYKMDGGEHTSVERLISIKEKADTYLNYTFIGNLVGSEWMNTCCPQCKTPVIKRVNALGCASQLSDFSLTDNTCPSCGTSVAVAGEYSLSFGSSPETSRDISSLLKSEKKQIGLLDIHGFQKTLDMRTGEPTKIASPLISRVSDMIDNCPYPGDGKQESDTWVTDMALELCDISGPDLVMLDYAQACFQAVSFPDRKREGFKNVFSNISRFLQKTGYEPIILGCGGLEPVARRIDPEALLGANGDEVFSSFSKFAHISKRTIENAGSEKIADLERVSTLISREDYLESLEKGYTPQFSEDQGELIAIAKPGTIFMGINSSYHMPRLTPALEPWIPVYTTLDNCPQDITDVAPIVTDAVRQGKRVALIIIEGAGFDEFVLPARKCKNHDGLFIYMTHEQYITLGSGFSYPNSPDQFPCGQNFWQRDYRPYPFSARFHRTLSDRLSHKIGDKRSVSVGNRNILTHVCLEADISLECYCCFQHNFGTMVVFGEKALYGSA
jgi:pyruvate formate lyase activating enzyme